MSKLQAVPEWLDAKTYGRPVGVDRENKVINGYIVAELGEFKTPGRGQFTADSLSKIVALYAGKPNGIKARFTHPSLSSDGLGSFLGQSKDAYLDGPRVRANLHLAESSFRSPKGDLGSYVMDLAEENPDAFGSSLVLKTEKVEVMGDNGRPKVKDNGDPVPPIWLPTALHASDVVDSGDAVHGGFLSAGIDDGDLPDGAVRLASEAVDKLFPGCPRDVVEARLAAWVGRYLDTRYGPPAGPHPDVLRRRLALKEKLGA